MSDKILEFIEASEEEQIKMFRDLSTRLALLNISIFKKRAKLISEKVLFNIPMNRLITLYNASKSDELRNMIVLDEFYQRVFKKTKNYSNIVYNQDDAFFKDFNLIVDELFDKSNNNYDNSLVFINEYSTYLFLPADAYNLNYLIDRFFDNKNKEHKISISLLDKLKPKNILKIYDCYKKLSCQDSISNDQEYVSNLQDFEKYLEHNFINNSEFCEIVESNLSRGQIFFQSYRKNILYTSEEVRKLIIIYLKFKPITKKIVENILNYLQNKLGNNLDDFSCDKQILRYLIHKNLQVDPERVIDIIYSQYSCMREVGSIIKEIEVLLYFNFLPIYKYHNNVEYLEEYDLSFLKRFNFLHLKNIFNAMELNVYGDEAVLGFRIAINMYVVFGYNRTIDILKFKYGELSKDFYNNISKIKISDDVLDDRNNIKLKQGYLNILFNEEKNSNFQEVIGDSLRCSLVYVLYNSYDKLIQKYGKITLKTCLDLLNNVTNITVEPRNNQLIRKDIYNNIVVGNRRNVKLDYLITLIENNYQQQQLKVSSSLPYIEGECDGYYYQTMRFNDPIIYNLGYLTNCCFRMTDIGGNDLKHAALDKNARILLIYNERKEVIAFSVLNRNGEVVIITSVEYDSQNKEIEPKKLLQVIKKFSNELYEKINNSNDRIRLITIGASSKIKPEENIPFPSKYPTPVCADEDKYQANGYHYYQHILFKDDSLNYAELKYNSVVNTYQDPRLPIKRVIIDNENIKNYICLIQRIDNNYNSNVDVGDILFYNEDWYILINNNGEIIGNVLDYDKRAIVEYNEFMNNINDYNKNSNYDIDDTKKLIKIRN